MSGQASRNRLLGTVLLVAVLLAACSKPAQTAPRFQGTLTVLTAPGLAGQPFTGPDTAWLADRARAYAAAHPGITVHVDTKPSATAVEESVRDGSAKADLVFGRYVPEAAARLADVDALLPKESLAGFLPGAREAFPRGIPVLVEAQVLALNTKAFQAAGAALPADGRWTYSEFENSLKALSGSDRAGLGFAFLPGDHGWWPFIGGLVRQDLTPAAELEEGLARLQAYRRQGWLHADTAKLTQEATWSQFAAGRFAVMPVSTWALPLLTSAPYQVSLAVAGFPGGSTAGYIYGFMLPTQADDLRARAAADLALYLAAPDSQVRLARQTGLLPASTKAVNPFAGDPLMAAVLRLVQSVHGLPAPGHWAQLEPQVLRPLRLALVGGLTPADAAAELRSAIQQATAPAPK